MARAPIPALGTIGITYSFAKSEKQRKNIGLRFFRFVVVLAKRNVLCAIFPTF